MGLFDGLFDSGPDMGKALRRLEKQYGLARQDAAGANAALINRFAAERTQNLAAYEQRYTEAVNRFGADFSRARDAYSTGMDQAYATLASGRDSTLALLSQATDDAIARANVSNALTGLGNTTFGQQRVSAIGSQGALQAGAVMEQYAQTLASARQAKAAGLAALDTQAAGGQFSAGLNRASNVGNMMQQYSQGILGAQAQGNATDLSLRLRPIDMRYQQKASEAQQQSTLGGSLIGGGIGVLGDLIGGAFL